MIKRDFTSKKCKYILNKVEKYLSFFNYLLNVKSESSQSTLNALEEFRHNIVSEKLKNMTIERFAKITNNRNVKAKVRCLNFAGYYHASDLIGVTVNQLMRIYGIGNISAVAIVSSFMGVYDLEYNKVSIKLSLDNKNTFTNNLVLSIFKCFSYFDLVDYYSDHIQKPGYKEKVFINFKNLKFGRFFLFWLFSSKSKKASFNRSFNYLVSLFDDQAFQSSLEYLKKSDLKIRHFSFDDAWKDFETNVTKYSIFIDNITKTTDVDELIIPEKNYLTTEIMSDIDKQILLLDGFKCTLRKYQLWGVKYIIHQNRVLLGDEMGLGKTIEAIAALVHHKNSGDKLFLVICPSSVLINWCREIKNNSNLNVTCIHDNWDFECKKWIEEGGVGVTTFGMLKKFNEITIPNIGLIVIDEAHYIKNKFALRTSYSKALLQQSSSSLLMTGTPLENNVQEMISLISLINDNVGNLSRNYLNQGQEKAFRNQIASVYCRRTRGDVLTELPSLIEIDDWCKMSSLEQTKYEESFLKRNYCEARRLSWNIDEILNSCKANRLIEIVEEAKSQGRKVLVFSFFLKTLNSVKDCLKNYACFGIINGSVNGKQRQIIIDEFEKSESGSVLIAQVEAGGTGLNMQAASVVVLCEPQFKPSSENQAISRSYRMGQARNVIVHRLLCVDTIDEDIQSLLKAKQSLFDKYAEDSIANEYLKTLGKEIGKAFDDEYNRILNKNIDKIDIITHFEYYCELANLSYNDLVEKMKIKYGLVNGDYFLDDRCISKNNKISRSNEGLECHHIDEYYAINLSDARNAKSHPFDYQKSSHLVYCNFLEHLLLHIKIIEENNDLYNKESVLLGIGGAVEFIIKNLNDIYSGKVYDSERFNNAARAIISEYNSYIYYLKYLIKIINNSEILSSLYSITDLAKCFNGEINIKVLSELEKTSSM